MPNCLPEKCPNSGMYSTVCSGMVKETMQFLKLKTMNRMQPKLVREGRTKKHKSITAATSRLELVISN